MERTLRQRREVYPSIMESVESEPEDEMDRDDTRRWPIMKRRTKHKIVSKGVLKSVAKDEVVALIPIRLDITIGADTRITDEFTWNLNESLLTPE
jgi:hypothetical protein